MTKASIELQDLRRRIYLKAKADRDWRFWGLYVLVCKEETICEAYEMARRNGGAAGIDGMTFEAIEEAGREAFLAGIRDELLTRTHRPARNRQVEIPKKQPGKFRFERLSVHSAGSAVPTNRLPSRGQHVRSPHLVAQRVEPEVRVSLRSCM